MARRARSPKRLPSQLRSVPNVPADDSERPEERVRREVAGITEAQLDKDARRLQHQRRDQTEKQKLSFRRIVLILATVAFGLLVALEWFILCEMLQWAPFENSFFVILAVSPIVAATTIIVFLLIGVFRGFRDADVDDLPVGAVTRGAIEGAGSP